MKERYGDFDAILKNYLTPVIPGLEPEAERRRIVYDENDGLAYKLFDDDLVKIVPRRRPTSLNSIKAFKQYINSVENYFGLAEYHSQLNGFGLVTYNPITKEIIPKLDHNLNIFQIGIGDTAVKSAEKFERFLEMIRNGRQSLYRKHEQVEKAIKNLK